MIHAWKRIALSFSAEQRGSVMPLVALGMFVLIGATGVAVDMGRQAIVQSRMQNALDSAGLAAGTAPSTANLNTVVGNYFYANFPVNYLGVTVNSLTVTPNANNSVLNLAVSGKVNTTFMNIFGIKTMNVSASSQITKQSEGMELVLVLDNTGSMNCEVTNESNCSTSLSDSKINALKTAAASLLNILYGGNNTIPNLWVGVVPFSQTVNIGTGYASWMNASYDSTLEFGPTVSGSSCQTYTGVTPNVAGTYSNGPQCAYAISSTSNHNPPATSFIQMGNWAGCVMARPAPYDSTDDVPATSLFQAYDYPWTSDAGITYDPWKTTHTSNHSSHGVTTYTTTTTYNYSYTSSMPGYYGPNLFCPQPVLPMVAEENTVLNKINSLYAGGSTLINQGMVWGWRMLSPNWAGLWGGEMNNTGNANFPQLPLPYHTALMQKVLVLMTDGMNQFDPGNYTAYKYLDNGVLGTTNYNTANSDLDTKTLNVCTALKNNGVIIYTIGFGTSSDVNTTLLTSCASKPEFFFLTPTNAQLQAAFETIGNSLANLYISH